MSRRLEIVSSFYDDPPERDSLPCARCGRTVVLGKAEGYLVDIRAVADPRPPAFSLDDLSLDCRAEIQRLLERIEKMSSQELEDQVYRRRIYCLCNNCYGSWIDAPFGRSSR
jgi:hypothetical protein